MRPARRALPVLGCAGLLLLAACSSPSPAEPATTPEAGPLTRYLEQVYGGAEQTPEDLDAQMRAYEGVVAACMQEQGFDYTPMDPAADGSSAVLEADAEAPDLDSEEYVAEHGYGMTTYTHEEVAPEPTEAFVDPNADYIASMSESEQAAYFEALSGPDEQYEMTDPDAEPPAYDWTTMGCTGRAQHEVWESEDPLSDPAFASLTEEVTRFHEGLATRPEVRALDAEWSACMADQGHAGYTSQMDAQMDISDRMSALYEQSSAEAPEPDPAAMAELRELEIRTALADLRCRQETGYTDKLSQITVAAEEEFVERHRAELDAWVEAHGREG